MGFDGAATFSGKHTMVLRKNSLHTVFLLHCHFHLLQPDCVQAPNATSGLYMSHSPAPEIFPLLSQASKRGAVSAWSTWAKDRQTVKYSLAGSWMLCESSQSRLQCNCEWTTSTCMSRHTNPKLYVSAEPCVSPQLCIFSIRSDSYHYLQQTGYLNWSMQRMRPLT